jgi:hypothetical protein
LSSLAPSIIQIFQKKADNEFELEKLRLSASSQEKIADINASAIETKSLYDNDEHFSGGSFWEAFRASVRPVITYAFFFLFVFVKVCAVAVLMKAGLQISDSLPIIWDDNTQGIFGAIMGYYFGSRAIERFGYGTKTTSTSVTTKK